MSKEATEITDAEDEETIWKQIDGNKTTKIKQEPEDEDMIIDPTAFLQGGEDNNSIDGSDNSEDDEDDNSDSEGSDNDNSDEIEDSEQDESNDENNNSSEQEDSDEEESEESEYEEPIIYKKKAVSAPIGKKVISKPMAVQNSKKFNPKRK